MENNLYYICDYNFENNILFYFKDFIEGNDVFNSGYEYSLILVGVEEKDADILVANQRVTLKNINFEGRFYISFLIKTIIKKNNLLYLYINELQSPYQYEFGAINLLNYPFSDVRMWLDMKGDIKKKYISASYYFSGTNALIKTKDIIIEGKYIIDYYSFYCELGYLFFGKFGYIGNNLYSFESIIEQYSGVNITWKDSDLALKSIDNTLPSGYESYSAYDWLSILESNCNLYLK